MRPPTILRSSQNSRTYEKNLLLAEVPVEEGARARQSHKPTLTCLQKCTAREWWMRAALIQGEDDHNQLGLSSIGSGREPAPCCF